MIDDFLICIPIAFFIFRTAQQGEQVFIIAGTFGRDLIQKIAAHELARLNPAVQYVPGMASGMRGIEAATVASNALFNLSAPVPKSIPRKIVAARSSVICLKAG